MFADFWQRFWERAPRQLRFTRAGRVLVTIALAAGLAAMNTGNNLLFFGWGMVLSAIVVSGVLSEASLRVLASDVGLPAQARVGEAALLPLTLHNRSRRMPAYAVELAAELRDLTAAAVSAPAPYQLRVGPGATIPLLARFVPKRRGRYAVPYLVAKTAYPFGFFEKSRRLPAPPQMHFWCFPRAIDVNRLVAAVSARLGDAPMPRAGQGDDFFSLRPYRNGDDMRRIAWRRSARVGHWVVVETEAITGRELMLEMHLRVGAAEAPSGADKENEEDEKDEEVEHSIAALGSLAEALLARNYRVGVRAPGTFLVPAAGARQRWDILLALARMNSGDAVPSAAWQRGMARVVLVGAAAVAPLDTVDAMLLMLPPMARSEVSQSKTDDRGDSARPTDVHRAMNGAIDGATQSAAEATPVAPSAANSRVAS